MAATLLMLWCLGSSCEEIRAPVAMSMGTCTIFGELYAADWQREHPQYSEHRLAKFTCSTAERI